MRHKRSENAIEREQSIAENQCQAQGGWGGATSLPGKPRSDGG